MKVEEWDKESVAELFKKYKFNRYIERFNLLSKKNESKDTKNNVDIEIIRDKGQFEKIIEDVINEKKLYFSFLTNKSEEESYIIKEEIIGISIVNIKENKVYYFQFTSQEEKKLYLKQIFENEEVCILGYELSRDAILLKQIGIEHGKFLFDAKIAAYLLSPTTSKYTLEGLSMQYLDIDIQEYLAENGVQEEKQQITLFEEIDENKENQYEQYNNSMYAYIIYKLYEVLTNKLQENNSLELFNSIEMPLVQVLADMQYTGMYVDKDELVSYGEQLKKQISILTMEIYKLAEQEFNINSPKQLGEILFEKLKLPYAKKNKNGYTTDVDTLEKIKNEHPIVEKILEYRGIMKLNSTYVEGLIPYIHKKDNRIHSYFHQTVTATGRISSTEPNLQNIPTRVEAGKKIRKAFKPENGSVYLDADYSQIELRVLAHISNDENMLEAFRNDEDIHKQAASRVFNIPIEQVTSAERSKAKAVNFGIVYGISDFGLAEQIGVSKKEAKNYIEQYLDKYSGIKNFMENIVEDAKEKGYVETLFSRRRYIPELNSSNYMVRQFGARAAMNTPIQGTAADIMKIAMINVYKKLKEEKLQSKIILQVHDELIIETKIEEQDKVKKILKESMENAMELKIPLKVELSVANNWYEAK